MWEMKTKKLKLNLKLKLKLKIEIEIVVSSATQSDIVQHLKRQLFFN